MNPLLGGVLFRDTFSTSEMRNIFHEEAFITKFLEVEAALARAEAKNGIVPADCAEAITEKSSLKHLDLEQVAANVAEIGLFSMSIIEAWKEDLGAAGEYIHWGASTQDISDTIIVLQLKEAYECIIHDVLSIRDQLVELAETYRDVPMVGRTQFMNGPPITFGHKVATWVDEIERHICRLDNLAERLFVVHLSGASGTLSAIEDNGFQIVDSFADELGLNAPRTSWTATRDRFAELLNMFAMIAGLLSRMSREILFLNRPEINELDETIPGNTLGSSTNPHKQNPVFSQLNVGLARLVRSHADTMNELMEPMGDRDRSAWYAEFAIIPTSCCYLGRMLKNTKENLSGLEIHQDTMEQNLQEVGSLVMSEAIMIALAEHVGRQTAHSVVHDNAMQAIETERDFQNCLLADDRVTEHLSENRIESLTDPTAYTGLSEALVDSVLESLNSRPSNS
ncbi:class-II fumarase/aspartase family protein [Haloarcula nitratireducens]|uniref:Adenylosuccinate lyase family protein n=1 Tax=Haloarcula nitratireducens TaxID=2487749 RepID=A0AAW4PHF3_9EURY|nr:adenylosuccinate lyase family protein [Halomicroarcula nitratireducens]MBX0297414.1 adenylosuccinate lyase family protein [Halomicroarcula nitratireducens]